MGEFINGYEVQEGFVHHSNCHYSTKVYKDGNRFFMKRFLSPKSVDREKTTSRDYADRTRRCDEFNRHHKELNAALKRVCGYGGSVVVTRDFFLHKGEFFKVTDYVEQEYSVADIARLPLCNRLKVMRSACDGIRMFHSVGIVHGDVKADNIILLDRGAGFLGARIIDFDSSYFEGRPYNIIGTPGYSSPEYLYYTMKEPRLDILTRKTDVYALGILFHEYAVGKMPEYGEYDSCCEAQCNGYELGISDSILPEVRSMIQRMLDIDFTSRPDTDEVFAILSRVIKKRCSLRSV